LATETYSGDTGWLLRLGHERRGEDSGRKIDNDKPPDFHAGKVGRAAIEGKSTFLTPARS
jgi:hypothetical protein